MINAATAFLICTFVQQSFFCRHYFFCRFTKDSLYSAVMCIQLYQCDLKILVLAVRTVFVTWRLWQKLLDWSIFTDAHFCTDKADHVSAGLRIYYQMILQIQRDTYQILSSSFLSFLCSSESDVAGEKSERPRTVFLPSVGMSWWGTLVVMAISSNGPFDVSLQLFLPVLYHPALWLQHRFLSIWQRCTF